MPEISRFYGIIIAMYYGDHNPPPFHARYGRDKIVIRINDLAVTEGHFPPRALGLAMEWAAQHREELQQNWKLLESNMAPQPIPPLK